MLLSKWWQRWRSDKYSSSYLCRTVFLFVWFFFSQNRSNVFLSFGSFIKLQLAGVSIDFQPFFRGFFKWRHLGLVSHWHNMGSTQCFVVCIQSCHQQQYPQAAQTRRYCRNSTYCIYYLRDNRGGEVWLLSPQLHAADMWAHTRDSRSNRCLFNSKMIDFFPLQVRSPKEREAQNETCFIDMWRCIRRYSWT